MDLHFDPSKWFHPYYFGSVETGNSTRPTYRKPIGPDLCNPTASLVIGTGAGRRRFLQQPLLLYSDLPLSLLLAVDSINHHRPFLPSGSHRLVVSLVPNHNLYIPPDNVKTLVESRPWSPQVTLHSPSPSHLQAPSLKMSILLLNFLSWRSARFSSSPLFFLHWALKCPSVSTINVPAKSGLSY